MHGERGRMLFEAAFVACQFDFNVGFVAAYLPPFS